jgi:hypothetical protein
MPKGADGKWSSMTFEEACATTRRQPLADFPIAYI